MSLVVENLSHTYHPGTPLETQALQGVSFHLEPGQWVSLVGHTGSGKSTLAQHLNALIPPQSGKVSVDGLDTQSAPKILREIRRKVGLVFQFPEQQLFAESLEEELAFGPRNWGFPPEEVRERVLRALASVGLPVSLLETSPLNLSGGQKRRVAIASVIASGPDYLVLDEPTAGLDARGVEELLHLLETLQSRGVGICYITHDLELALSRSERILVLQRGRTLSWGTPEETVQELQFREMEGLVLPPILELARHLRDRGRSVPLTWDWNRLASALAALEGKP